MSGIKNKKLAIEANDPANTPQAVSGADSIAIDERQSAAVDLSREKLYLTKNERAFVAAWMPDRKMAEIAGAIGVKPSTASVLKSRPAVREAIRRKFDLLIESELITQKRIIAEDVRIATSSISDLFSESGGLIAPNQLDSNTAAAIASIEVTDTPDGEKIKYKFWDKGQALNRLQKVFGMQTERHQIDQTLTVNIIERFGGESENGDKFRAKLPRIEAQNA
jgi:hypothetical protein